MPANIHKKLKASGTRFEYRVRDFLQSNGWTIFRSAGSYTSADLIAMKPGPQIMMVQCKASEQPDISKKERADLLFYKKEFGAVILIVARETSHKMAFYSLDKEGAIYKTSLPQLMCMD